MFSSSKNESKGIEDINRHRLNHKPWRLDIFKSTATDRDPQSFNVNAWICAPQATDRDPQSFSVSAWICACQTTDRDLETKK